MSNFNLSAWALNNRTLVLFIMIVLAFAGIVSYQRLGQSEDPPFTFKIMVVRTLWPGATAQEVSTQVTDRIEKKLMETGSYEFIRSYSRPGESLVMFMAKDSMFSDKLPALFYQVRKKTGDIKASLPEGVVGPFFNDEFGDTFGNIYALSGDGFDYATLKNYAERLELELHRVKDVNKVDLIGLQDEKIWIELFVRGVRFPFVGWFIRIGKRIKATIRNLDKGFNQVGILKQKIGELLLRFVAGIVQVYGCLEFGLSNSTQSLGDLNSLIVHAILQARLNSFHPFALLIPQNLVLSVHGRGITIHVIDPAIFT